jgi:hypothetical protein
MNFQIGDKVKVISLSKIKELYPKPSWGEYIFISKAEGCRFTQDMLKFCGLTGTITNVWPTDDGTVRYSLSFYGKEVSRWSWVPEFFETVFVTDFEEV